MTSEAYEKATKLYRKLAQTDEALAALSEAEGEWTQLTLTFSDGETHRRKTVEVPIGTVTTGPLLKHVLKLYEAQKRALEEELGAL